MLKFTLDKIPVSVHLTFLVIAFFGPSQEPLHIVLWTAVAFLAVLLHEYGHAFTARHYGATPVKIMLFALGGVTTYPAISSLTAGQRFRISAAGSMVGFITGGPLAFLFFQGFFDGATAEIRVLVIGYAWASVGWGLLNWIPIRPMDGGAMLTSALQIVMPRYAVTVARWISLVVGIAAAYFLYFRFNQTFAAVFVLFITGTGFLDKSDAPRDESETLTIEPDAPAPNDDAGPPASFPI